MVEIQSHGGIDPSARAQAFARGEEEREENGQVIEVRSTPSDAEEYSAQEKTGREGADDDDGQGDGSSLDVKESSSWDGVQEGGVPLSRAERRKRIKAEIQRLAHADKPVYYQRRLW